MQLFHAWQVMYPPLPSHTRGWLEVGNGHQVYWEECGNPLGHPALFVHGGPGQGCASDDRRWFDPRRWRIILFDQRGAGRSRPLGRLVANDTGHLLHDMETLRRHLNIDRWLLFAGSWGATLALAYAQRHPERLRALVLRAPFTATAREQRWLYSGRGAAAWHPAAGRRFQAPLAPAPAEGLLTAYAARLHCGDPTVEQSAASAWLQWEQDLMDLESPAPALPEQRVAAGRRDVMPARQLASARIGLHFARHAFFLEESQLLMQASRLRSIPGVIVQGRRDLVTPAAAAVALHQAWPTSRLFLLDAAGHRSSHPAMAQQLVAATDSFRAARPNLAQAPSAARAMADSAT